MVLPKTAEAASAIAAAGLLEDKDLHTRLAALLVMADAPATPELGRLLYKVSANAENYSDRWLSRAMFIAATRHKAAFLTEYKADPKAVAGRLAADLAPHRRDQAGLADARQRRAVVRLEGDAGSRQLGDARPRGLRRRGVVHADRRCEGARRRGGIVDRPGRQQRRSLGQRPVGAPWRPAAAAARHRRPAVAAATCRRRTSCRPGTLKNGANVVTVRITNNRNDGGFLGTPDSMFVQAGETRVPLAGAWRYRVERQTNAGALYSKPGELAAHVALASTPASATGTLPETVVRAAPDVVIRLSVTPGEMKFDKTELNVAPGQLVEIVFTNPDTMQHNFLLGQQNSLNAIGTAADELARTPNGPAQQYVPQIPAGAVLHQAGRTGRNGDGAVQGAGGSRPVSVCLHVPRPLADHERDSQRARAAGAWGTGRGF